jgi:DNA mismatch repair protein MLH1
MSTQKGYPQHQVRTDASSRTLQAMGFTATRREDNTEVLEEAGSDDQPRAEGSKSNGAAKVPESECLLTSVRELRREAVKSRHNGASPDARSLGALLMHLVAGLSEVLRGHAFVGVVDLDMGLSLVQHETKLYLVNHAAIMSVRL